MADVDASLPRSRDGRQWYPAGGTDGKLLLNAEQRVLPAPGEAVGQGASRYDQQFWLWDPASDAWQLAWSNGSDRYEAVYGVDREWAVSRLHGVKPGVNWTIRLHSLATGEQREVASLDLAARGFDSISGPAIGSGHVAYVHKVLTADASFVERVELYDIAGGLTTTIAEAALPDERAHVNGDPSIAGGKVSWRHDPGDGGAPALMVHDIATGDTELVPGDAEHVWSAVAAHGKHLIGESPGPIDSPRSTMRYFVRDLAGGTITTYLQAAVWLDRAHGEHVSWMGQGTPTDLRGFYDIASNTLHVLDAEIPVRGQNSGVVDGWFFWAAPGPEGPSDVAGGTLHFVQLE